MTLKGWCVIKVELIIIIIIIKFEQAYFSLSYDITVIQWITSCHKNHKNRITTHYITLWQEQVTSWQHPCQPASVAQLDARPTGDQEVAGSTPAEVGNILSWRLIMKYFLRSFSPFRWFKKGSCQFLAKECAQYWLTAWRTKPAQ